MPLTRLFLGWSYLLLAGLHCVTRKKFATFLIRNLSLGSLTSVYRPIFYMAGAPLGAFSPLHSKFMNFSCFLMVFNIILIFFLINFGEDL